MDHETAFRDSPEERKLYEMGLEVGLVTILWLGV